MGLIVDERGAYGCPVVVCDWCKKQIEDVEQGNVYWYSDDPATLFYNHKTCARDHDNYLEAHVREGEVVLSEHLEVFLAQLLGNTGRAGAASMVDKKRLFEHRG